MPHARGVCLALGFGLEESRRCEGETRAGAGKGREEGDRRQGHSALSLSPSSSWPSSSPPLRPHSTLPPFLPAPHPLVPHNETHHVPDHAASGQERPDQHLKRSARRARVFASTTPEFPLSLASDDGAPEGRAPRGAAPGAGAGAQDPHARGRHVRISAPVGRRVSPLLSRATKRGENRPKPRPSLAHPLTLLLPPSNS
jgi:hypothetical protein